MDVSETRRRDLACDEVTFTNCDWGRGSIHFLPDGGAPKTRPDRFEDQLGSPVILTGQTKVLP